MAKKSLSPLAQFFIWITAFGLCLTAMKAAAYSMNDALFIASMLGGSVTFGAALGSLFARPLIGAALGIILFFLLLAELPGIQN